VPSEPPPPDDVGGEPQPEPEPKPVPEQEPAVAATQEVSVLSNGPLLADDLQPLRDMLALMPERSLTRYFVGVEGTASRYLRYLPGIFHENDFMGRYLQIFETIWEPQEWRIDHVNMYFDPRTCPTPMLDWLANWLDLTINPHWPEARRRRLLAEATDLYRWRGTRYGMTRMIEVCTGLTPDVSDDPAQPFVFRVRVQIPPDSDVDAALIEDLVRAHKPAHAGYVIEIV
jgi:phage tail-like protein